ncbi:MAG TPA: NADH-quinone oxidoreductase subunit L [Actinomycetota bacterium]|nr:NADH-quinone oxidoreductase subunit L [Actinomycetota bacterium]
MVAASAPVAAAGTGVAGLTWLLVLLPLVASLLIVFLGRRMPARGAELGIAAVAASFLLSLATLWRVVQGAGPVERSFTWAPIGSFTLQVGWYVDGLAAVMFVMIGLVSLCVHVYSLGYMQGDARFTWFYAALALFTGSMLNLVAANNLFQLLVGWELVGICSYLLIGHWWEEHVNSSSAIKAFITTKTGDVPFIFGIFTLVVTTGTSNIPRIAEAVEHGELGRGVLVAAALLLFGGAIGKSAQFPLHVWLPDAMAGPTPVSALIHAATMVVAGVYLVGRMFGVFAAAPGAMGVVSTIAGITMLIAALLAMVQDDIKRVLAYSTVSQLAYMLAGLSLGEAGYTPGLFHMFTHAFFKALLFLGAGSVIHAVHSNNMSEMGGLRKVMPVTFWTFLIGSAALAGIPPLAGFWSKDEIITTAFRTGNMALWATAMLTAVLTAFYMSRAVLLTFFGPFRGHGHPHESPAVMTAPLVVLAAGSVLVGFLGAPQLDAVFADWVHVGEAHHEPFSYGFAAISVAGALLGIAAGYRLYARWREREPLRALGPAYTLLERKYFLDDLYWVGIVRPVRDRVSAAVDWSNRVILDGIVHAFARAARGLSRAIDLVDARAIDGAVNGLAHTTGFSGGILRYIQSGNVQRYAAFLFTGVIVLAIVFTRF